MTAGLATLDADTVVRLLDLKPHPEGGFYRETFRDPAAAGPDGRAASTAIYFLLPAGVVSRWHRVDAAEIWHWYAGAPLELSFGERAGAISSLMLGPRLDAGERPQAIVPVHHWQQARSRGDFTLVGCTVAPAFEFSRFEILPDGASPP